MNIGAILLGISMLQGVHVIQKDAHVWQKTSDKTHIACTKIDQSYSVSHVDNPKPGESSAYRLSPVEDYKIDCTIKYNEIIIYHNEDIAPSHPISKKEADRAIGDFVATTAQEVIDRFIVNMQNEREAEKGKGKKK